jgi:UDP-N-acetylmuramoyl-L-alanyl-D-glutamate--2,6-diaminopimelate ligase
MLRWEIEFDSRKIEKTMFCRYSSSISDGHDYIQKRYRTWGCRNCLWQLSDIFENGITYVQVKDTNKALALMAAIILKILRRI